MKHLAALAGGIAVATMSVQAWAWQNNYQITDPYNPMNSYTVNSQAGGGYRVQNTYDPTDAYTVTPQAGGGYRAQDVYDPTNTRLIQPMFPQYRR